MEVGGTIASTGSLSIVPASVTTVAGMEIALADTDAGRRLVALAPEGTPTLDRFEGESQAQARGTLLIGPLSSHNARLLRDLVPWLRPRTLGLRTSAGFGDRLGSATPGHIGAMRVTGGDIAPIFAQQSIREMERTHRDAPEVLDDAMWGVLAEGWREGYGADADHLKTVADIDRCLAAGYTFYTFDPGDHVGAITAGASSTDIQHAFESLPWEEMNDSPADLLTRYGDDLRVEDRVVSFGGGAIQKAAIKYGRAIAHVGNMYRHLAEQAGASAFEVEVSVDETDEPTSHAEHVYIARELRRLGVEWVSLAPRYIGQFEKGVDYIGDVEAFADDFAVHAAIARELGPYKLSLHSGSDKFSIYPVAMRETRGLVHLKTAGTSYLEALRTLAHVDPGLLTDIYAFARERFEDDKASYHISARLDRAPDVSSLTPSTLPDLLEQFDARQVLHVTFGSVLTATDADGESRFGRRLHEALASHPEVYASLLERHFVRHLKPFAAKG